MLFIGKPPFQNAFTFVKRFDQEVAHSFLPYSDEGLGSYHEDDYDFDDLV